MKHLLGTPYSVYQEGTLTTTIPQDGVQIQVLIRCSYHLQASLSGCLTLSSLPDGTYW